MSGCVRPSVRFTPFEKSWKWRVLRVESGNSRRAAPLSHLLVVYPALFSHFQDKQMKLLTSMLERVAPTVRRDCNYSNLDRVKAEATWDEESGQWTLPDLKVEKVSLPATGNFCAIFIFLACNLLILPSL